MSVDIIGTICDQCRSTVQYYFTSTETVSLVSLVNNYDPTKSDGKNLNVLSPAKSDVDSLNVPKDVLS